MEKESDLIKKFVAAAIDHGWHLSQPEGTVKGANIASDQIHEAVDEIKKVSSDNGEATFRSLVSHESLHVRYWAAVFLGAFDRDLALKTFANVKSMAPFGPTKGLASGAIMIYKEREQEK